MNICTGIVDTTIGIASLYNISSSHLTRCHTICRVFRSENLHSIKKKKPLLKKRHMKACLTFALEHKNCSVENRHLVVWFHETKINRNGLEGRQWVWKSQGKASPSGIMCA